MTTDRRDMRNIHPSAVIRWEDSHRWKDIICCMCWNKAVVRADDGEVYCRDHKPEEKHVREADK